MGGLVRVASAGNGLGGRVNCPVGHPMRMIGGGNIAASGKKTRYWHCDTCTKKFYVTTFGDKLLKINPVSPLYLVSERRRLIEAAMLDVKIDGRISGQTMAMAAELRKKK